MEVIVSAQVLSICGDRTDSWPEVQQKMLALVPSEKNPDVHFDILTVYRCMILHDDVCTR